MATCKDCLHIDVCYWVEHYGVDVSEDHQEDDCLQFQDSSKRVKAVLCQECRHHSNNGCPDDRVWCRRLSRYMDTDGFCSYGERKDNERKAD